MRLRRAPPRAGKHRREAILLSSSDRKMPRPPAPLRQAAVGVQKAAELIRYTVKRYCGRGLVAGYELAYISGSFSCRYVGGQRPVQQAKHRDFANAMESHVQGGSAFWPQIRALGWPLISDRHRKSLADANFPLRTGRGSEASPAISSS